MLDPLLEHRHWELSLFLAPKSIMKSLLVQLAGAVEATATRGAVVTTTVATAAVTMIALLGVSPGDIGRCNFRRVGTRGQPIIHPRQIITDAGQLVSVYLTYSNRISSDRSTACVRSRAPSFPRMFETWILTVPSAVPRASAISRFV